MMLRALAMALGIALLPRCKTSDARGPDGSCAADAACDRGVTDGPDVAVVDDAEPDAPLVSIDAADAPPCDATCGGACVDLETDPRNCGACGRDCRALPHVVASLVSCAAGACVVPPGACEGTWAHCSGVVIDGCETDLTSPAHCGACATRCEGATPYCAGAGTPRGPHCVNGCEPETRARCGGACVDLQTDPRNCGACGRDCRAGAHVTGVGVTCVAGACVVPPSACEAGWGHCTTAADDGCETDLTTAAHCGACATSCAGATPVCAPSTTSPLTYRCSDRCADASLSICAGACVDTAATAAHCGACGRACPTTSHGAATCAAGVCGLRCLDGFHRCGAACLDDASPLSCGASCEPCRARLHATPTCAAGVCGSVCDVGFHECAGACVDETDPATCGASCAPCPVPEHGSARCVGGACRVACAEGYMVMGGACEPFAAPRPIAPASTSTTTSRRPTLRWSLPATIDGAHVELCRDRVCRDIERSLDVTGTRVAVPSDLAPGVHFWRLAGRRGAVTGAAFSATWEFFVGARTAPVDTSHGTVADFNGDGFADVVVGAYGVSGNTGRAYVYLGGATGVPATPSVVLSGIEGRNGNFGWSVASAGDVDGDGFADLAVSADQVGTFTGRVYVYLGGATGISATPSFTFAGPDGAGGTFGWSIAGAGDVNGDGYGDVVVGATGVNGQVGRAYVYLGGAMGPPAAPSATLDAPDGRGGQFGASVAGAGDVNGDGLADIVIGASGVASFAGRAYVYLGSATGVAATPSATLPSVDGPNGEFGASVAGAGDLDGDGLADLLVGASGANGYAGRAYVFSGNARALSTTPSVRLAGVDGANGLFGHAVAGAGDVNGDGFGDVVIGADGVSGNTGRAYVFLGAATGLATAPSVSLNSADGMNGAFGRAVAGAGDANGDGFGEVLVAADGVSGFTGVVSLFSGRAGALSPMPSLRLMGPDGLDGYFGRSVAMRARARRVRASSERPPRIVGGSDARRSGPTEARLCDRARTPALRL